MSEDGTIKEKEKVTIEQEKDVRFHYDVFENPPLPMTVVFALQVTNITPSEIHYCIYSKYLETLTLHHTSLKI